MKILRTVLATVMALFALVQLNDPDALVWTLVYAVVALALLLAAWRPDTLRGPFGRAATAALLIGLLGLVVLRWPEQGAFWRREVWWEEETAREGLGVMIAFLAALFAVPRSRMRAVKSDRREGSDAGR